MKKTVIGTAKYIDILLKALQYNNEAGIVIQKIESDVLSFDTKQKDLTDSEYIVADAPDRYGVILNHLSSLGITAVRLVNPALYVIHHFDLFDFRNLLVDADEWKESLDYIEFHVTDNCNLKCKGCTHFCNLVKGVHHTDFVNWQKDIDALRKLVKTIYVVRILGGEPFLNPKLSEYVAYTRKLFSDSEIHIVSNGLLFETISDSTYDTIRNNEVIIDVSYYPLLNRDKIVQFLSSKELKFRISTEKTIKFSKSLDESGNNNEEDAYKVCVNHGCHFMHDGEICTCAMPLLSHYFNEVYGSGSLPEGGIDLHNETLEYGSLRNLLDRPIKACKYCSTEWKFFEWEGYRTHPAKSDWVIG